ncbi:MAG: hypothetical protein GY909_14560 [Oligoflexia bacterium]|nr:hypothetical protein [Oligoflexia bacterium]
MVTRLLILLLLLFTFSCEKKSELTSRGSSYFVKVFDSNIEDFRTISWKVGAYGKQTISKGMQITVSLPVIKEEDLETLHKEKKVDSWLLKVTRMSSLRRETVGYFSVEFMSRKRGTPRVRLVRKTGVGVFYSAASISMRLSKSLCPAFKHNKKIEDIELKGSFSEQMISLTAGDIERINAKVPEVTYSPLSLNGGSSLKGRYYVDVALYNKESKIRYSSYLRAGKEIVIDKEESVFLKGCQGKEPVGGNNSSEDPVKNFKFKR